MKPKRTEAILAMHRAGRVRAVEAAQRLVYKAENPDEARALLVRSHAETPDAEVLEAHGNLCAMLGEDMLADAAHAACLFRFGQLHYTNLIRLGYPGHWAVIDAARQVLYIPISKCANTTVRNYLDIAAGGRDRGTQVHRGMGLGMALVHAADLTTRYAGWLKFAVIRDPIDRLASYHGHNIAEGTLRRATFNLAEYDGLSTAPGAAQMALNHARYRRLFLDYRHHTDPMSGYLGPFVGRDPEFLIFTMRGLDRLRAMIEDRYGVRLEPKRDMATSRSAGETAAARAALEPLREFYAEDDRLFGAVLAQGGDEPVVIDKVWTPPTPGNWLTVAGVVRDPAPIKALPLSVLRAARRVRRLARRLRLAR